MERKKAKGVHIKGLDLEDTISKLPDSLISHILLCLPTKDAIRTSVLSKRWKNIWLSIPGFDLNSREFPNYKAFVRFMEKSIELSREDKSCLHKLKLSIRRDVNVRSAVDSVPDWIEFVATRKLKHLDVEFTRVYKLNEWLAGIPSSLYICQTLNYLRLHRVKLVSLVSISLPNLKTMCLENNIYHNEASLESLISSCSILEDLSIVRKLDDNVKVLRVRSMALTSLSVGYDFRDDDQDINGFYGGNWELLIDAPRLKYLNLKDELSKSKTVVNLVSLAKIHIDGSFRIQYRHNDVSLPKNQLARSFFTGISKVRDMIISKDAMGFFLYYTKVETLPQFCNLSRLEAEFYSPYLEMVLPTLLESCPNLKSIVLDISRCKALMAPISSSSVPKCLLSSLKVVEMKHSYEGRLVEIEVARYFIENSVLLKKLVVHVSSHVEEQILVVLRDLLELPRPSSMCRIVYVTDG